MTRMGMKLKTKRQKAAKNTGCERLIKDCLEPGKLQTVSCCCCFVVVFIKNKI